PSVSAEHLAPQELETLAHATLDHLRSRPGGPSGIGGWSLVTARDAAVMAWWAKAAELTPSERRRLESLRQDVYEFLAEHNLVVRDQEHRTSLHVSPAEPPLVEPVPVEPVQVEPVQVEPVQVEPVPAAQLADEDPADEVVPTGAWVLKLSPYLYDVDRVFGAADRRVHVWSVEDHVRSTAMQYGDPVYLWVADGDPYRPSGVWGVGTVAGPTVLGVPDEGWLDYEAAGRARVFAVVDIRLLDVPVIRETFVDDARLVDAEVIRDPFALNPGVLTSAEHEALAEHVTAVAEQVAEEHVA
ncbi:MAG TPA: hypothetical protein VFU85_12790, partial [Nocardioides sp.]|nr:hypothetical protein [Nocardioides sp.]